MANFIEIVIKAKDQASGRIRTMGSKIKGSVGKFITIPHIAAATAVIASVKKMIAAYGKQEEAIAKLNAVLRTYGIENEGVTQALKNHAAALQKVTKFGDEEVIAAQAMLLQLGVMPEHIERATVATLDWATAMGKDAVTAAIDIGKAGAGNLMMLQRYGVQIDKTTVEAEGFGAVLDVLESKFAGQAEAVAKKGTGPLKQFQNVLGDVFEDLGEKLIPGITELANTFKEDFFPILAPVGQSIMTVFSTLLTGFSTTMKIISAVTKGRFKEVINISRDSQSKLKNMWTKLAKDLVDEEKKTTVDLKDLKVEQKDNAVGAKEEENEELKKQEDERIKEFKSKWEDEFRLRRELRDLDLESLMEFTEQRIEMLEEDSAERLALEQLFQEQKRNLQLADFEETKRIRSMVQSEWGNTLDSMLKGELNFTEGSKKLWADLGNTMRRVLAETVAEEAAKALTTIAIEKAKAASKAISAHAGIPFVGLALGTAAAIAIVSSISKMAKFEEGGIVTGPTFGLMGEKNKKEAIIPLESARGRKILGEVGMGGGGATVYVANINIQFPNVVSFQDWFDADPTIIKEVTERKIFEAMETLAEEGKYVPGVS